MHDTQPASEALCSVSLPELIRLCHPSQPDAFFFSFTFSPAGAYLIPTSESLSLGS